MADKREHRRKRGQAGAGGSQSPELGRESQRDAAITESSYEQGAGAPLGEATFTRALEALKRDICDKLECKIDTVTHTLRSEISSVKAEFKAAITTLQATVNAQGTTIKDLELSATTCSDDLTSLQSAVKVLTEEVRQLQAKCEDLEGRSRRNNIRLVGIPEGLESSNPREFISHLLQDLLKLNEAPLLDRVHRSLGSKPREGTPPRPLLIRVHYFHVKEQLLRLAGANSPLLYQGRRISIFPDFTPAVAKKRSQFTGVKRLLHSCPGIKFGLFYPAELRVTLPDGVIRKFTDPASATDFANKILGGPASQGT
uniref:L1 transposable element RRM domain-containing protein n=1 Tax=Astatotilapia calliptera TaxID=8154 RepID=A0AAX7UGL5_ASTCA